MTTGVAGGITTESGANITSQPADSSTPPAAILELHQLALAILATSHSTPQSILLQDDDNPLLQKAEWAFIMLSNHTFGAPSSSSQSPSPGSSPASVPLLLTHPPAAPVKVRPADDNIRKAQKEILTILGAHFFRHYVKVLAPPLASKCLQSFAKAALLTEASTLYIRSLHFPNPPPAPPAAPHALAAPSPKIPNEPPATPSQAKGVAHAPIASKPPLATPPPTSASHAPAAPPLAAALPHVPIDPAPPIPKGAKSAYSILNATLEASSHFLLKTIREEREDFAEVMMEFFLPHLMQRKLTEDEEKLARDIFANFVPDVLYATLQSFSATLQKMDDVSRYTLAKAVFDCMKTKQQPTGNLSVDQMTGLLGPIMLLMPDSIECGLKTLCERLSDPALNELVVKSLQEPLLGLFFPKPGTLSPKVKHIIVHVLKEVYNLLKTLNTSKENAERVKLDPAAKASNISTALLQNICMNHKLFGDNEQENNVLEKALESLCWMLFFPGDPKERTPMQQLYMLLARTAGTMCITQLFDPYTLHCLIKRLLKQKISLQNPFERPTAKKRPNLDPNFSKDLDELIPKILTEIINFKTDNGLLRKVGQLALDFGKLINKLPKGDDIQTALIELSESDAILLPAILVTQIGYQMEPFPKGANPPQEALRQRFITSLGRKRPAFDAKLLLEADADKRAQLQEKVNKKIMENTEELEELLKDLPLGTGMAIDLIRKVYQLIKDPAMANILATYIVVGAKKGLEACAKTNESLPKNVDSVRI